MSIWEVMLPLSLAALTLGAGAGALIGLVMLGRSVTTADRNEARPRER